MNLKALDFAICAILLAVFVVLLIDPSLAQSGPLDGIATKTNDARDQIINVGKAIVGAMAAVMFVLAAFGRVPWMWVGMLVIAGAGLQSIQTIQSWLNS